MKVVLDTNVIVSAFVAHGLCHEVLEVCIADHDLVLSEYILSELVANLVGKIGLQEDLATETADYLRSQALMATPSKVPRSICRDKDDLAVIGTAVSGGAEVIVSGDKDLLTIGDYQSIKLLSPRAFWEHLTKA